MISNFILVLLIYYSNFGSISLQKKNFGSIGVNLNIKYLSMKRIKYGIRLGEPNGPIGEPNRPMSTSPKKVEPILRVGP